MKPIVPAVLVALVVSSVAPAAEKEPLVDQVNQAIDDGVRYLKGRQRRDGIDKGSWEVDLVSRKGGQTCLVLLALLYAGEDPRSEVMQAGLKWLRDPRNAPIDTYVIGLQTMVFAEARQDEDLLRIQKNVNWLIETGFDLEADAEGEFVPEGGIRMKIKQCRGWGYRKGDRGYDHSNTQYALLGLHAGKMAGAKVHPRVWEEVREFYLRTQQDDGGWNYQPRAPATTITMTVAGLCGLLISGMEAGEALEKLKADGSARDCGVYKENQAVANAMQWLGRRFTTGYDPFWFYNLYGIERAGRLSGQRFIGDHDWYRAGCKTLVGRADPDLPNHPLSGPKEDGSWTRATQFDNSPIVSTSFALLFLTKGRTPVLISKLVHHPLDRPNAGWNNKHSDARHLVDFVNTIPQKYEGREALFKDQGRLQPVAWQIFNPRRIAPRNARDLAAELLQTPIAYFNGHDAPVFSGTEKEMLKEYVEQGGFILAEACCGRAEFDRGFRALVHELWDDKEHELRKLPPNHPIYSAFFPLAVADEFPLYGIEFGCKTQVVYSPRPLAGYWEANQTARGTRGEKAFQLGANIIAYATGREAPKPRGTEVEIPSAGADGGEKRRGVLKVVHLMHAGARKSQQRGVTYNLMLHLRTKLGIDVYLEPKDLPLASKKKPDDSDEDSLLNYKFFYMHGKNEFQVTKAEVALLKANLEDGGLLFADACCGSKQFDASFRQMIREMFGKDLERIDPDEEAREFGLYSGKLNRTPILSVKCRREPGKTYENMKPALEGIKVGDRWAVIYSRYDIGCALEKHQSTDCVGHDYESALRLGSAVVLYALQR